MQPRLTHGQMIAIINYYLAHFDGDIVDEAMTFCVEMMISVLENTDKKIIKGDFDTGYKHYNLVFKEID